MKSNQLNDIMTTHGVLVCFMLIGIFNKHLGLTLLSSYFLIYLFIVIYIRLKDGSLYTRQTFYDAAVWPYHALRFFMYVLGTIYMFGVILLGLMGFEKPMCWDLSEKIDLWLWNYTEEEVRSTLSPLGLDDEEEDVNREEHF